MKRGESFRERWRGSNKNFTLNNNNNNNNNTVDFRQDDELDQTGDTDGALSRRSSLRRSFSRKIRKYVKYEGGRRRRRRNIKDLNFRQVSIQEPRGGLGLTKTQSLSALGGISAINDLQIAQSNKSAASR